MYKLKICLVKNSVYLFLVRSCTGIRTVYGSHLPNLICICFIACFFSLWYACGCFMSTSILSFLCMGFHEHMIRVYLYWGKISHGVLLILIFDVPYFASR